MSVDTTLAVLYAQSNLSNAANVAMVAPQASLAMTRVLAAEALRQERYQIEKSDKTDKPGINADEGGKKGFFQSRLRARRARKEAAKDEAPPAKSPIIGNLLNVKV